VLAPLIAWEGRRQEQNHPGQQKAIPGERCSSDLIPAHTVACGLTCAFVPYLI